MNSASTLTRLKKRKLKSKQNKKKIGINTQKSMEQRTYAIEKEIMKAVAGSFKRSKKLINF